VTDTTPGTPGIPGTPVRSEPGAAPGIVDEALRHLDVDVDSLR
jgi:hypothetical protein